MKVRHLIFLITIFTIFFVSGCGSAAKKNDKDELRVGTITGPETQFMQVIQNVAFEKYGLKIRIVEFNRYSSPNAALMKGDIDINMFQHQPYLISWNAQHSANLIPIQKTFIYPMGIYSLKVDHFNQIGMRNTIAIPKDVTNQARALLLMQKAGLISLKPGADILANPHDIMYNPKQLNIVEYPAWELPKMLKKVDAAVINSNYALEAGLHPEMGEQTPTRLDALYLENKDSLYANVFVIRPDEKEDPRIQKLMEAFQSPQVLSAAQIIFRGNAIKAW